MKHPFNFWHLIFPVSARVKRKRKWNRNLRAAVRTHSLEIREPPQKYWSSMNKATCLLLRLKEINLKIM
jgi:hypothetical protein